MSTSEEQGLITTAQLAKRLAVSTTFLRRNRMGGMDCPRTIPFIKLGRNVRYDWSTVKEFLGLPERGAQKNLPQSKNF